ncbi:hypothetical protein FI667_g11936, partial [Globisporangium splendens]
MADSAANLAMDTRTSTQVHFPTQRAAFNNLTQDLDNDVMHWLMRSSEDPSRIRSKQTVHFRSPEEARPAMYNFARRRPLFAVTVQVQQLALSAIPTAGVSFDQLVLSITGKPALSVGGSKQREFQLESQIWNFQCAQLCTCGLRYQRKCARTLKKREKRSLWPRQAKRAAGACHHVAHRLALSVVLSADTISVAQAARFLPAHPVPGQTAPQLAGQLQTPASALSSLWGTLTCAYTFDTFAQANKKSRYPSLLAGFSVDVIEHFDHLLALNDSAHTKQHRVPLTACDGVCAPQSSLSLFLDSLHFLPPPASSPRSSVAFRNSASATAAGHDNETKDRQIELVPLRHRQPRRRSPSRLSSSRNDDSKMASHVRASRTRSASQSSDKQNGLTIAMRANAQISSKLMASKLETSTFQYQQLQNPQQYFTNTEVEIGYEIDEDELARRFYTEITSNDSRETVSNASGASTPRTSLYDDNEDLVVCHQSAIDDAKEQELKAKQLDLERQVAALLAENQAKTALIKHLMEDNSRLVAEKHSASFFNGQEADLEWDSDVSEDGEQISPFVAPIAPTDIHVAKRKLQMDAVTSSVSSKVPVKQNQLEMTKLEPIAANEAAFEGLVKEIQDEFAQLFSFDDSYEPEADRASLAMA